MSESQGYSFIDHMRSKAMKFWARLSDDEEAEVCATHDEIENEQGIDVDEAEIHKRWDAEASLHESEGPTERPDYESPGTYPPSHRHLAKDRGPHGV